jgi:hypothetical protein
MNAAPQIREIDVAMATAFARVVNELEAIAMALAKVETLLQFVASAATTK